MRRYDTIAGDATWFTAEGGDTCSSVPLLQSVLSDALLGPHVRLQLHAANPNCARGGKRAPMP